MAEHAHTTPTPSATREDFDEALSQAQTIADIMGELSDAAISNVAAPSAALYSWLTEELRARLERIEVADMTMRRTRA